MFKKNIAVKHLTLLTTKFKLITNFASKMFF